MSDLVPPLRWSDAATIPLLRDQPDLPDAWWRSLPLAQVLTVLEPDRLAAILAGITLEHWPAAAVGDVLPALYVLDPDEADEPCTAIALDRTGSWPGLLALTGRELRDQPFIQPLPVLITLFAAVLGRVAHPPSGGATAPAPAPVAGVGAATGTPAATASPRRTETSGTTGGRSEEGEEPAVRKDTPAPADPANSTAPESAPDRNAAQAKAPKPAKAVKSAKPAKGAGSKGAAKSPEPAASPGAPGRPAAPGNTGNTEDAGGSEDAEAPEHPRDTDGSHGAEAPAEAPGRTRDAGGAEEPRDDKGDGAAPASPAASSPAPGPPAAPAPGPPTASAPAPGPPTASAPAPGPPAREAARPGGEDAGRKGPGPATDLHALLDAAFAGLDDRSWAVAQNRVFTDAPAAVEALAKLFAVGPETIREVEAGLRRRLGEWLASEEAAPYREHLAGLGKSLGKASPKARLIAAAPWHSRELHSLDVPAWHFVLATLSGYHLTDEWLVEGDITELRHRTRDVISGARPPLTMTKALDLVVSLGIRPEVSKEWLENVPQLRILAAGRPSQGTDGAAAPPVPPGLPAATGKAGGTGRTGEAGGAEGGPGAPGAPFRPLKDVSLTRRCFRQPDGRWWLRIDVTDEHIQGAECALPTGFAAYLGMSPGSGRKVHSAVGEMTLSWHERPALESFRTLLEDAGAKQGSHLFLTLSDEGVLRARHLPAAGKEVEAISQALRLVGYTAPGGTPEQAGRVIATRVGMTGPVNLPDLLIRLRERGDRDLLSLLA